MLLKVPSCTFHLQTIAVTTVFRSSVACVDHIQSPFIFDDEGEGQLINGDFVFSSKVLLGTSDEGLWEDELVKPKDVWKSIFNPPVNELNSTNKIVKPGSQWLQCQETVFLIPLKWDLIVEQGGS